MQSSGLAACAGSTTRERCQSLTPSLGRCCRHTDHKRPHPQRVPRGKGRPGDLQAAVRTNQWGIILGQQVSEAPCFSEQCCKTQLSCLLHALTLQAGCDSILTRKGMIPFPNQRRFHWRFSISTPGHPPLPVSRRRQAVRTLLKRCTPARGPPRGAPSDCLRSRRDT